MSPNITKSLDVAAFAVLHYTGTASAVVALYLFHRHQYQTLSALRCVWTSSLCHSHKSCTGYSAKPLHDAALADDKQQRGTADHVAAGAAHVKGMSDSPVPSTPPEQKKSATALPPPHPTAHLGRTDPTPASSNPRPVSELGDSGLVIPAGSPVSPVHEYNANPANNACMICYITDRTTTLAPCGHYAMCK